MKESNVQFDNAANDTDEDQHDSCQHVLPPEIVIHLDQTDIKVQLVHDKNNPFVMVG